MAIDIRLILIFSFLFSFRFDAFYLLSHTMPTFLSCTCCINDLAHGGGGGKGGKLAFPLIIYLCFYSQTKHSWKQKKKKVFNQIAAYVHGSVKVSPAKLKITTFFSYYCLNSPHGMAFFKKFLILSIHSFHSILPRNLPLVNICCNIFIHKHKAPSPFTTNQDQNNNSVA